MSKSLECVYCNKTFSNAIDLLNHRDACVVLFFSEYIHKKADEISEKVTKDLLNNGVSVFKVSL